MPAPQKSSKSPASTPPLASVLGNPNPSGISSVGPEAAAQKKVRGKATLLTDTQIKNAKPGEKPYKLYDPNNLVLLVAPNGAKLWRFRFKLRGKAGLFALGRYPEISLSRARELHKEARELVANGIDPVNYKRQDRLRDQLLTFGAMVESWRSTTDPGLRDATIKQRTRELNNDLLPKFGRRHLAGITRLELLTHLRAVEKRAPETARNLRTHLNAAFEHGIDAGMVTTNPTPPRRLFQVRRSTHHRAIPSTSLGDFVAALASSTANEETRAATQLMLLTACRKAEAIGAKWSEFDLKAGEWTIPAERMKGKRQHWIPLPTQAVKMLSALQKNATGAEHVFPNRRDSKRPMAARSINALFTRLGYAELGTPHGMRAAFSTHFNQLGASIDVIEHCLAHVPANAIRAAYNRHQYKAERREMLQQWADHLDSTLCVARGGIG